MRPNTKHIQIDRHEVYKTVQQGNDECHFH